MTKIYIGTFPLASEMIGVDDVALKMIAEANRAADLAREERTRQAPSADEARAKTRFFNLPTKSRRQPDV